MKTNDKGCHFIIIIQKGILFIKCVYLEKWDSLVSRCLVDSFRNKGSLCFNSGHGRIVQDLWKP